MMLSCCLALVKISAARSEVIEGASCIDLAYMYLYTTVPLGSVASALCFAGICFAGSVRRHGVLNYCGAGPLGSSDDRVAIDLLW